MRPPRRDYQIGQVRAVIATSRAVRIPRTLVREAHGQAIDLVKISRTAVDDAARRCQLSPAALAVGSSKPTLTGYGSQAAPAVLLAV
jgi:hypothetical protein